MNKRCGAEGVKILVVFKMSSIDLVVRYRINFSFQRQMRLVTTVESITIVRIDLVDDRVRQDGVPVERQVEAAEAVQGANGAQQGAADNDGQA